MTKESIDIRANFEARGEEDWQKLLAKSAKPLSPQALQKARIDGLQVKALYTQADAVRAAVDARPGVAPFLRGAANPRGWTISQHYSHPLMSECRQGIAADQGRGAEALWLELGLHANTRIYALDDLDQLLESVCLDQTEIRFEPHHDAMLFAAAFVALANQRDVDLSSLNGAYGCDPLTWFARDGFLSGGLALHRERLVDLARWSAENTPNMRAISVSAQAYQEAGATEAQELSYALASGVDYLRSCVEGGLDATQALGQFEFVFAVGGEFFAQIAKMRAARRLWSLIAQRAGVSPDASTMKIYARTSRFHQTVRDPWVNMVRACTQCAAAALGGADTIGVEGFDRRIGDSDDFARRVARNTQLVLREESRLGHVRDPGGGSWYIESLSEALAAEAWKGVQVIERAGGMSKALRSGAVRDHFIETSKQRRAEVATRATSIVGVSVFANLEEESVQRASVADARIEEAMQRSAKKIRSDLNVEILQNVYELRKSGPTKGRLMGSCVAAIEEGFDIASVGAALKHGLADLHIEPLARWHLAEEWEALRGASDRHLSTHGSRPSVFFVFLGPLANYKARGTWAQNLFAAAGIETSGQGSFQTLEEAQSAWEASGASAAVLCGDDAEYQSVVDAWSPALKAAGCAVLATVGDPGEKKEAYAEAGVDLFLHNKAGSLALMRAFHERLGVGR